MRVASYALHGLLAVQILLGAASVWVVFLLAPGSDEQVHHSAYPTLHVLVGACLLAQLVATRIWSRRTLVQAA